MTDQPDQGIPEVVPPEHIAPETPPMPAEEVAAPPETERPALPLAGPVEEPPASAAGETASGPAEALANSPGDRANAPAPKAGAPAFEPIGPAVPAPRKSTPRRPPAPASKPPSKPSTRPERYQLVTLVSTFRALIYTVAVAVIVATILMWQTTPGFLPAPLRASLVPISRTAENSAFVPTNLPTPFWMNRIGIVAGHSGIATYGPTRGNVDPGAVCDDGFRELDVTTNVAQQVVAILRGRGLDVDLLEEFDPKIDQYQANVFLSIHADSCVNYNDGFPHSGFAVAHSDERPYIADKEDPLTQCLTTNYAAVTGLPYFPGQITLNMTHYHSFNQEWPHIANSTPGSIIELGLLYYDRDMLQHHTDKLATGIVNGIMCFVKPESAAPVPPTKAPPTRSFVASPTPKP
ncbi:MAG TPA: N-acetylmuramoyl-L-alanine amidase [Aggregatilineales bacterium]|nr:N-acetylmuramoyl-L-alanine amidase [Aggregatilineales bacterium]